MPVGYLRGERDSYQWPVRQVRLELDNDFARGEAPAQVVYRKRPVIRQAHRI